MTRRRGFDIVAVVVLVVLPLAPTVVASGSATALLRIPIESVGAVLLLALLPWRAVRRAVAVLAGLLVVLAAFSSALDRGFHAEIDSTFNVVTGWSLLVDGYGVLADSNGPGVAAAILAGVIALAVVLVLVVAWALLRLDRLVRRHRVGALRTGSVVTAAWVVLALVGARITPGLPLAAADVVGAGTSRVAQAITTSRDQAAFAAANRSDPYADVPSDRLLDGLRGKDVVVAFVESYGQVAVQGTSFSAGVDRVLRDGDTALTAHGWSSRSAWLNSPTFGGISWLAHSTLQTGEWVDSQERYDEVTASKRLTLASAFRKAGWNTVSDIPSDTKPWPVGSHFYHYDEQLDGTDVGYAGPRFSYARVPDQYTLQAFQQRELAPQHRPLFAEIDLDSSHTPWTPLPSFEPWDALGDGSVYDSQPAEGVAPAIAHQDPAQTQQLYGQSVQYSLTSLFSFLTTFDDPNLVLVELGDHQPHTIVSGNGANHLVPISVIAKDPGVLDAIESWHWEPGVLPSPTAPAWAMSSVRNRFLDAFDG